MGCGAFACFDVFVVADVVEESLYQLVVGATVCIRWFVLTRLKRQLMDRIRLLHFQDENTHRPEFVAKALKHG